VERRSGDIGHGASLLDRPRPRTPRWHLSWPGPTAVMRSRWRPGT